MYPEEITLGSYDSEATAPEQDSLLERIRAEGQSAFDEVFGRYRTMVFHLAYRILGDREEALDVSQEVFLAIFRKLGSFRGESSLKTWIYRITVNRASNRCRWWNRLRRKGSISLDEHLSHYDTRNRIDSIEAEGKSPEENLLAREQCAEIERSLQRLPIHQRIAVIMRDVEGMSYEEIAESTQVSLGTVKSRIARGREELKRNLNGALA